MEEELHKKPALLIAAVFDGYDFGLQLNYIEGMNAVLKEKDIGGRFMHQKDSGYYRYWRIQKQLIEESSEILFSKLMSVAGETVDEDYDSFTEKLFTARQNPVLGAFISDVKENIYPLADGGVALIGSYHPGIVALARNMKARYLPAMKAWKFSSTTVATLANNLMTELLLHEDQIHVFDGVYSIVADAIYRPVDDRATIQIPNSRMPDDSALPTDTDNEVYLAVTTPLERHVLTQPEISMKLESFELYDYQRDGVVHLISQSSSLLADDMGLGKTRQAVVAAHLMSHGGKILITCPASLIINWIREIEMVFPDARIATQEYDQQAMWTVTNYERLEALIPHADKYDAMVIDEAHFLKEPTTKRTRIAFDIAAKVRVRMLLTGTPVLNRECEIHTLLRLSGHPIGNIPLRQFENEFAGSADFRRNLNSRISEWMLRRKKDVVLKTLKGKQHQVSFINPSPESRTQYDVVSNDGDLLVLAKIGRLRRILENAKVTAILEMVSEMRYEDKVLIFCEFTDTVSLIRQELSAVGVAAVTLVGSDTHTKRQKAVDEFQSNADIRAFIGTTLAAGVGINLTAANYAIFASLPWTPALKDQAEDRAYRNGQQRLVIVKIPLMEDTIDEDLWEMLKHKKGIANDILDSEKSESQALAEFASTLSVRCIS